MADDESVVSGMESEYEYYEDDDGEEAGLPAFGIALLLLALTGAVVGVFLMTKKDAPGKLLCGRSGWNKCLACVWVWSCARECGLWWAGGG